MRRVPLLPRALLCLALGGTPLAAQRSPESASTCAERGGPGRADPDLYCIDLFPTPALTGATGVAELGSPPSPFGVAVSRDGHHRYDVSVSVRGLPDPATLGAYTTYVAWATTPLLRPVVRLGEVREGRVPAARVELDKFLVLVSAEADAKGEEPRGRMVLRGMSASTRMQPDELAWMLAATLGGDPAGHHDHGDAAGWIEPPMHPQVSMPPELMRLRPAVAPFLPDTAGMAAVPLAVPRRLVRVRDGDTLRLEAGRVRRRLFGRELLMYGFNGQYPGPLIQVDQGATLVVDFHNRTELPTAVHWHGIRLDNRYDGVPHVTQEPVQPGGSFRYHVRFPDAGIYWYHPHHREDVTQDLGLYGNLLVSSSRPGYYAPANREEVLMLDDLLVAERGLVPYGRETATHALMGRFGNALLVNGEPRHDLEVRRGEVVRFYLTNVASTRTFNLSFGGAPMKLVASDLGKYERERWVESVPISPAERYVVEVRFDAPGEVALTNRVQAIDHLYGSFFPEVDTLGVVRVLPEPASPDHADSFRRLRENAEVVAEIDAYRPHFSRPVDRELVLGLQVGDLPFPLGPMLRMDSAYFNPVEWSGTMPEMDWVATGREVRWILRDPATGKENEAVDWRFRVGETVKLRLTNDRRVLHAMQHPIHVHGQRFLVLARNGVPSEDLVWKDTLLLPVGATADVLLELSNPGRWMLHCHIAEHLETGMRMLFEVTR